MVMQIDEATLYLTELNDGHEPAADGLFPLIYEELHKLAEREMRNERADHTLQPTALVHEAYLRLIDQRKVQWNGRSHFFAIATTIIRRILLQHARDKRAAKRGSGAPKVNYKEDLEHTNGREIDLLALDEGLTELAELNKRQSRVVELRYFGGLGVEETATLLDISPRTVKSDWRVARAWLRGYLTA